MSTTTTPNIPQEVIDYIDKQAASLKAYVDAAVKALAPAEKNAGDVLTRIESDIATAFKDLERIFGKKNPASTAP